MHIGNILLLYHPHKVLYFSLPSFLQKLVNQLKRKRMEQKQAKEIFSLSNQQLNDLVREGRK